MKYALLATVSILGACNGADFGSDGSLTRVVGVDRAHVWAIGGGTASDRVYQLDSGGAHELQQFPGETLAAIAANSPADVWVVGTALHHFDGDAWTTIEMPSDPVVAIGNQWAVGAHGTIYRPGATLDVIHGPDARVDLTGITAFEWGTAADNVWVTDGTHLFRFTSAWTDLTPPAAATAAPAQLEAITGGGPADVWVGTFDGSQYHYDGAAWTATADRAPDALILGSWESGPADVWAVGFSNVILHFDGAVWTQQPAPPQLHCMGGDAGGTEQIVACTDNISLSGVWGSAANDVWVVGYLELDPGGFPLLFHYDGTSWTDLSPS